MTTLKDWRGTYRATRSTSPRLRSPLSPDITYDTTATTAASNTAVRTAASTMPPALPTHFLQTKPSSEVYPSLQTAQSTPPGAAKAKKHAVQELEARMFHGFDEPVGESRAVWPDPLRLPDRARAYPTLLRGGFPRD